MPGTLPPAQHELVPGGGRAQLAVLAYESGLVTPGRRDPR